MATWDDVEAFLNENYESDMLGTFAGPNSFAAVVEHTEGSEVVLVMDAGLMVQIVGFLDNSAFENLDLVFNNLQGFGIKVTGNGRVALVHSSMLESLDGMDLVGPLQLLAFDITRINKALGV